MHTYLKSWSTSDLLKLIPRAELKVSLATSYFRAEAEEQLKAIKAEIETRKNSAVTD